MIDQDTRIAVSDKLEPLILDCLEWIARAPRTRAEVLDAWRTSCPRLTIWEDVVDRGLAETCPGADGDLIVRLTTAGRALLAERRPSTLR